jgi:hypothetical protein
LRSHYDAGSLCSQLSNFLLIIWASTSPNTKLVDSFARNHKCDRVKNFYRLMF